MTPEKTREQTAAAIAAGYPSPVRYDARGLPAHLWREGSAYATAVAAPYIMRGDQQALRWYRP